MTISYRRIAIALPVLLLAPAAHAHLAVHLGRLQARAHLAGGGLGHRAAAMLGGMGNPKGALVGGFLLGLIEALTAGYLSSQYKDAVAFVMILLVLFVRPQGLFGRKSTERV